MTNAELIKAVRCCIVDFNSTQSRRCNECPYRIYADGKKACENKAKRDAADALEEADEKIADCIAAVDALDDSNDAYIKENERLKKRIAELEADKKTLINVVKDKSDFHATKDAMRIAELEAQLPKDGECEAKKPKTVKETECSFYCDCPTCGGRLISNVDGEWYAGSFDRFCRMCGQKIDWSEYCGWSNKPYCGARMRKEELEKQNEKNDI